MTSTWRPASNVSRRSAAHRRTPRPASLHHGDHRPAGKRSARHRHRRAAGRGAASRVGALVRSGRVGALEFGGLAHAGLGDFRRWPMSGPSSSSSSGLRATRQARAAGAGRRIAAVGVRRRDRRRDRFPARYLDGWFAAAGVARGLRGVDGGAQPISRRRTCCSEGIRFDHVSFAYPGTARSSSTTCR